MRHQNNDGDTVYRIAARKEFGSTLNAHFVFVRMFRMQIEMEPKNAKP